MFGVEISGSPVCLLVQLLFREYVPRPPFFLTNHTHSSLGVELLSSVSESPTQIPLGGFRSPFVARTLKDLFKIFPLARVPFLFPSPSPSVYAIGAKSFASHTAEPFFSARLCFHCFWATELAKWNPNSVGTFFFFFFLYGE